MDTIGMNGEKVHSKVIDEKGKYTWIKSPRYDGKSYGSWTLFVF